MKVVGSLIQGVQEESQNGNSIKASLNDRLFHDTFILLVPSIFLVGKLNRVELILIGHTVCEAFIKQERSSSNNKAGLLFYGWPNLCVRHFHHYYNQRDHHIFYTFQ